MATARADIDPSLLRWARESITAANRLSLVATASVIEGMEVLSELIGRFDPGAQTWKDEWNEARAAFAETARMAVARRGQAS